MHELLETCYRPNQERQFPDHCMVFFRSSPDDSQNNDDVLENRSEERGEDVLEQETGPSNSLYAFKETVTIELQHYD